MSINDNSDKEIVTLGTVNAWAFKIAIWCAPIFALWMVNTVLAHDKSIGLHELRLSMLEHRARGNTTQSINVGSVESMDSREIEISRFDCDLRGCLDAGGNACLRAAVYSINLLP